MVGVVGEKVTIETEWALQGPSFNKANTSRSKEAVVGSPAARPTACLGERKKHQDLQACNQKTKDQPLCLAFDDLHFATPEDLDWLDQLVRLTSEIPLLVVIAGDPRRIPEQ